MSLFLNDVWLVEMRQIPFNLIVIGLTCSGLNPWSTTLATNTLTIWSKHTKAKCHQDTQRGNTPKTHKGSTPSKHKKDNPTKTTSQHTQGGEYANQFYTEARYWQSVEKKAKESFISFHI
jgi:hypothetical protein